MANYARKGFTTPTYFSYFLLGLALKYLKAHILDDK